MGGGLSVGLVIVLMQPLCNRKYSLRQTPAAVFMATFYFAWVLICQILSPYAELAWWGFLEHCDGTLAHLSYGAVLASAYLVSRRWGGLPGLNPVLVVSSLLVMVLGWMQYFGHSIWDFAFFREWFDPLWSRGIEISSKWGKGAWTSTLNAENWAGGYLVLLTPFAACQVVGAWQQAFGEKDWRVLRHSKAFRRALFLVLGFGLWYGLLCLSLAANGTRSAWFGTLIGLFLVLLWSVVQGLRPAAQAGESTGRSLRQVLPLGLALVVFFLGSAQLIPTKGVIPSERLATTAMGTVGHVEETIRALETEAENEGESEDDTLPSEKEDLLIESRGQALILRGVGASGVALTFLPAAVPGGLSLALWRQGQAVPLFVSEDRVFRAAHPELQDLTLTASQSPYVYDLKLEGFHLPLYVSPTEVGAWRWGRPVRPEWPRIAFAALPDHFANLRGYILNRGLPLVPDRPIFGIGAGVFPEAFPQADFSGKRKFFGMPDIILEKPHSLFLGNLLYFGFVGFFLFVAYLVMVFIGVFERAWSTGLLPPGAGAAIAALSYLFVGLFVDSTPGVSPLFRFNLGLCLGSKS